MTETKTAPSPTEVDQAAKEYLDLKDRFMDAKFLATEFEQQMALKGEALKELVSKFGSQHAEKSKLLHGLKYEAMCTFGQSSSIDAVAVEQFREALVKHKQARMLKKLFEKTVRWTLRAESSVIIRKSDLTIKLQALYAKCIVLKDRTPSLSVREKTA